nr:NADH dehydrogenase subunit 6 [Iniistius pavo]
MTYTMIFLLGGMVMGLVGIASNPSPYFAALGLVMVAGVGCGAIAGCGGGFLSLVLFLIYLGGMLVVFAYTAALAAEPYPENWLSTTVTIYAMAYLGGVAIVGLFFLEGWHEMSCSCGGVWQNNATFQADAGGVAFMYSFGGWGLVICAGVLLLTLFVVLELTRGLGRGTVRVV